MSLGLGYDIDSVCVGTSGLHCTLCDKTDGSYFILCTKSLTTVPICGLCIVKLKLGVPLVDGKYIADKTPAVSPLKILFDKAVDYDQTLTQLYAAFRGLECEFCGKMVIKDPRLGSLLFEVPLKDGKKVILCHSCMDMRVVEEFKNGNVFFLAEDGSRLDQDQYFDHNQFIAYLEMPRSMQMHHPKHKEYKERHLLQQKSRPAEKVAAAGHTSTTCVIQ